MARLRISRFTSPAAMSRSIAPASAPCSTSTTFRHCPRHTPEPTSTSPTTLIRPSTLEAAGNQTLIASIYQEKHGLQYQQITPAFPPLSTPTSCNGPVAGRGPGVVGPAGLARPRPGQHLHRHQQRDRSEE